MAFTNPPQIVTDWRAQLLLCSSAVSAGLTSGQYHYPAAALESDDATSPDSRPCATLAAVATDRTRYAEMGVLGLPSFRLYAIFYIEGDTGTAETLAQAICSELLSQSTGLPMRSASFTLAAEPTAGQAATDATTGDTLAMFTAFTITAESGLSS